MISAPFTHTPLDCDRYDPFRLKKIVLAFVLFAASQDIKIEIQKSTNQPSLLCPRAPIMQEPNSFFSRAKSSALSPWMESRTVTERALHRSQGEGYWEDAGLAYYGDVLVLGWGTRTLCWGTVV